MFKPKILCVCGIQPLLVYIYAHMHMFANSGIQGDGVTSCASKVKGSCTCNIDVCCF